MKQRTYGFGHSQRSSLNCMFPVEYVYADWCGWLANNEAKRVDPESPTSPSERCKDTGSQVEGFCIPQFVLRNGDISRVIAFDAQEH